MKFTIKTILKQTKLSNNQLPIYLRVTFERKHKFFKTPFTCSEDEWDKIKGRFKVKRKNYLQENRVINMIEEKAYRTINKLIEINEDYSLDAFEVIFTGENKKQKNAISFSEYFQNRIDLLKQNEQVSSAISYECTYNSLIRFEPKLEQKKFININFDFLTKYEINLRKHNCEDGGIGVYMRNIRAAFNYAIKEKIITNEIYPFNDFKVSKFKSQKVKKTLTKLEIQKIIDFDITNHKALINAKYSYLFSFFMRGMNFTDLAELRWDDLIDNRFSYNRNKTGILIQSKIQEHPILQEILDFYRNYRPFNTQYIFPILNKNLDEFKDKEEIHKRKENVRKYYNNQLKKLLKVCKIDKSITFYTARHTFATISLKNGVSIEKISQSLGHQDYKTTKAYLDEFNKEELDIEFENLL